MLESLDTVRGWFVGGGWHAYLRASLYLVFGFAAARIVSTGLARVMARHFEAQTAMITRKVAWYGLLGIAIATALHHLGVDLSVLLGAAGILTVAVGFASQTSASNIISGLFLLGERPFVLGDYITVGATTGEVVSIDLLSVKLRTRANLYVRVPNETLLKTEIINLTYYPIRRLDILVGVSYNEDLKQVTAVLLEVADRNAICLDEPRPQVHFETYGDSALQLKFSVWAAQARYFDLSNTIHAEIKAAFDEAGIVIPFPQRTLHAGSPTEPFPVHIVGGGDQPQR